MSYAKIALVVIFSLVLAPSAEAEDQAELGNAAFERGDFQKAATHYAEALRSKPSFALHVNIGHCYTRLERWNDAAQTYRAAIELDGEAVTAQIWRFLAQALYNDQQFQEAMKAFIQVGSLEPGGRDDIWIARCMIELEQWVQAQSVLSDRLKRASTDVQTLELLAYVLGRLDHWPGVIDVYRQLLIVSPDHTDYRISLANALAANGRNKQAIDILEFAWRVDRSLSDSVNRLLADLYLTEQMPQEAAACYARLIVASENPAADDFYRLGITYFKTNEMTSAKDAFKALQKADPADSRPDLYLGYIDARRGDSDKALGHYSAAKRKNPTLTEAVLAIADLQMKAGRYEEAAGNFAEVIRLGDARAVIHHNHVLALMRLGNPQQILAAVKAAIAEHPSDKGLLRLLDECVEKTAFQKDRQ